MKREPIRTPFLAKGRDADYADSLSIFKLILRFMNDTSLAGTRETILADYIVNKVNYHEPSTSCGCEHVSVEDGGLDVCGYEHVWVSLWM